MKKKVHQIATGDCVTGVKAVRSSSGKLYCIFVRLRVSEWGKSFEITYNPKNGRLSIYRGWQLSQIVGLARYEAIVSTLLLFFGGIAATLTR